ncbi:putative TATA element modulatory factor [Triangularia verruculosa]|uniref:TATA element modulatory factor n=1 Tax=Triangularia verruculosa TaxID=2587418 RepID=A0AAN6XC71_9PEZI|nr:putative TATA element modulatory factor [Triangularia verruculosa]
MAARWGSFLTQAVAGVEARLDNILSEDNDGTTQAKETKPAPPASPVKQSPGPSRTSSSTRANDRLQERLARAIAAKTAGQKPVSAQGSPRQSLDAQSRTSIDSLGPASPALKDAPRETPSPRASQDVVRTSQDSAVKETDSRGDLTNGKAKDEETVEGANGARISTEVQPPVDVPLPSTPTVETPTPAPAAEEVVQPVQLVSQTEQTPAEDQGPEKDGDNAQDEAHNPHQEEIHSYIERIDALEAKLQFLAREATDSARKAALAAPAGSVEKKLAEKDQQIAQLMEEGKKLASTEQKHRTIMKKLQVKVSEGEREINNFKIAKDKSDKELDNLRQRARRADELERSQTVLQKQYDQAQKELGNLRPEVRSKDAIIADLKAQLQKAKDQAEELSTKANERPREQDKRRIDDLEEEVAALKVEKNLIADRAKAAANDLKEQVERANERARALELELKAEVQMMEGKLEAMRMRAEEASSGVAGDSQAKLLRQIEQLQTQYSIASENWQGIETNLLARIAGLEKERDEALQRESDMRRKAREAAVRAKRHKEELEETKIKIPTIQEDVKSYQAQLDALTKRAEGAEAALDETKAELEKQKQAFEAEKERLQNSFHQPIVERPRSWLEDLPGTPLFKPDSRPASPQLSAVPQRTFSTDFLGIQTLTNKARKISGAHSTNSEAGDANSRIAMPVPGAGTFSRRPSAQPPTRPNLPSHPTSNSGIFSPTFIFSPTSEAAPPSILNSHREIQQGEDAFSGSGGRDNDKTMLQDMVSVSTVAAGPSVQLVERMSAAIRRLESEKVAAKEELLRISKQRDEARAEIVAMMKKVEENSAALNKVEQLESEVREVKERYETTLELLGEKSEEVEELRADVADVKAMYRDLVERTIK